MHDNDILESLDRGLTQAAAGELWDLGSFADDLPPEEPEKILITPEEMAAALAVLEEIAELLEGRGNEVSGSNE